MKYLNALLAIIMVLSYSCESGEPVERPNILWITCEDISPYLGSYGCKEAQTPHLDQFANESIRYTKAYANAPVCAVARSTILSGMYASTTGTHQMRSYVQLPEEIPAYPKILRDAGYYCTNNAKKDYNSVFENDTTIWDESSRTAHYKNKMEGQPFFAVFNIAVTHESRLDEKNVQTFIDKGQIPDKTRIDPADIDLPPYHPDLPEVRQDWARLHDLITLMDQNVGKLLDELEDSGHADNTIVFFYSDHGGQLARSKRFIYNVGTQVPFIVRLPEKWKHLSVIKAGGTDHSLVSFVDLAKTLLSLTACEIPEKMQGRIFLGNDEEDAPEHVFFFRDRMAELYDFCRAVTDGEHYFIRNFMPHRPQGRSARYGYTVQANWRAWEKYFEAGKCDDIQSQFYRPKPVVALFNTGKDPWHVANLAQEEEYQEHLIELSDKLDQWMIETRDIGLIPEPMFADLVGEQKKYKTIYEFAQSNDYPIRTILEAAKQSSSATSENIQTCLSHLNDDNPIIRYWGAYVLFIAQTSNPEAIMALKNMMQTDQFAANRIMAAQGLGFCGDADAAYQCLIKECHETTNGNVLLQGVNALQYAHLEDQLTKDDWLLLKTATSENITENTKYGGGYSLAVINDAINLWPDKRQVDKLFFNPDGTIQTVVYTPEVASK